MNIERAQLAEKKVQLDNLIAQVIMGWHTIADDPRRLWHAPDGSVVRWMIWEQHFNLCAHPYIGGVNHDDDRSFDPIFNHHRDQVDWWQVMLDKVANDRRREATRNAHARFTRDAEHCTNVQRIEALIGSLIEEKAEAEAEAQARSATS